jgi:23S rRNA (uracil1939-C5)-methyltransferase
MKSNKQPIIDVELVAMAHGGQAIGRAEGKTVFLPYAIPGEVVRARIIQDKGRVAFAEGVTLLEASVDRVFPECSHFGVKGCSRCHWQYIDYPAQIQLKQDVLADQLARVGGFTSADVRDITPSPIVWGYRHRMTFERITHDQQSTWGLPATTHGQIIPIEFCHILHPELMFLFDQIDFDTDKITRISLQIGTEDDAMLVLHVDSENDAPELLSDLKASINLILPTHEPVNLIGDTHNRHIVKGVSIRATAGADFRANVSALGALVDCVLAQLLPTGSILDLYGGVGLFSAFIAPQIGNQDERIVTLVESYPPAATDAEFNLQDYENVDIIEGVVEDVLSMLDDADTVYHTAILDPSHEGLTTEVIDLLGEQAIPRLIYVADDPATLARDAGRLAKKGYQLGAVYPFDLEPHTYYVTAVAVLDYVGH